MPPDSTFRERRREPSDRRSWRHTPVFVGDPAVFVAEPDRPVLVTGILPRGRVEIVEFERLLDALGEYRDPDDVQEALADGRVRPRSARRRDLSPMTEGIADAITLPRSTREPA